MKAEEIVKALRSCVNHNTWPPDCESCPLFREKLCVQQMLEGAADFIESLQAQLAESQRREQAAVEMLPHDCGNCKYALYSGACKLIPDGDEFSPDYTEGFDRDDCEQWEWRALEAGEGEKG